MEASCETKGRRLVPRTGALSRWPERWPGRGLLALLVSPGSPSCRSWLGSTSGFIVTVGACPASLVLSRVTSLRSAAETGR